MTDDQIIDVASLARIYTETVSKLDSYSRRVNEGKDLPAALEFSQWVLWCGITSICLKHARSAPKIDGAFLKWKAEELQRAVRAQFVNAGQDPKIEQAKIDRILNNLDILAGHVSRLVPPPPG